MVESPYNTPKHDRSACVRYALWCCHDTQRNYNQVAIASHLTFTQWIPETKEGRELGLACRDLLAKSTLAMVARYTDLGETPGMYRDVDCTATVLSRKLPPDLWARWLAVEWPEGSVRLSCNI
jgi:hypothetical protein